MKIKLILIYIIYIAFKDVIRYSNTDSSSVYRLFVCGAIWTQPTHDILMA